LNRRRLISGLLVVALIAVCGWIYYRSLVPAVHPDHDHGLENIAGGGFLRVAAVEGGWRNLVGRPDRVLILHWFELQNPASASELPLFVDYAMSVANDPDIEIAMIALSASVESVGGWARDHGVPTVNLYVDEKGETASLMGVRRIPETLIYDPEGHLVHQTRGPVDWSSADLRAAIESFKHGGEGHEH